MQLRDLKGLGPKRLAMLNAAGIHSAGDLLWQLPRGYVDTTVDTPIAALQPGQMACVAVTFLAQPAIRYLKGLSMVTAKVADDSGTLQITWFNQPWNRANWHKGDEAVFHGRAERFRGQLVMQNPRLVKERGIIPQYSPIESIASAHLAGFIEQLLPHVEAICPESLSPRLRQLWQLCGLTDALRAVHRPQDAASLSAGKRRIAFENLLLYQMALRALQGEARQGIHISTDESIISRFWRQTGFAPTGAQQRVLGQILADMASGRAMRRLVQGDVGSGKTAVAFGAVCAAAAAGWQSALMAPTEILARQHLISAREVLEPLGIRCGLLLGGMKAAERREALAHIEDGTWDLVIGTHALLGEGVRYHRLALVITDEQHRFGVRQRQRLSDKAHLDEPAHVLVMSATPIPRTLALILYGDLDVSVVDELPPGRTPVATRIVPEDKREGLYQFIRQKVAAGEQAYLVCPLVEESERVEAKDAQATYRELSAGPLKGLRLGLTWGTQPPAEKEEVIARFSAGEIDVLVATTVIEVGVNVPRATVMVIENADRFGLSQLHQLRGRVGRGTQESWCFLLGEPNERLRTLSATNDGFVIAQKDLELRGPGDFLGTRQHGRLLPDAFGVGDMRLIEETRAAVHTLTHDPELAQEEQAVRTRALQKYERVLGEIGFH